MISAVPPAKETTLLVTGAGARDTTLQLPGAGARSSSPVSDPSKESIVSAAPPVGDDEDDSFTSSFSDSDFSIDENEELDSEEMEALSCGGGGHSKRATGVFLDSLVTPVIPKVALPSRFAGESSYRLSMTFLLSVACLRLYPEHSLVVQSSYGLTLDKRSYLCRLDSINEDVEPLSLSPKDVARIKEEVLRLVDLALPFESMWMSQKSLQTALKKQHMIYTMKLIRTLNQFQYNVVRLAVPKEEMSLATALREEGRAERASWKSTTPPPAEARKTRERRESAPQKWKSDTLAPATAVLLKSPKIKSHVATSSSSSLSRKSDDDMESKTPSQSPKHATEDKLAKSKSGFDFPTQAIMSMLAASDISHSSLNMRLDDEDSLMRMSSLTMHKNVDIHKFDVYVTLQHRDFLGNTKFLRYFELFCVEDPFEDGVKRKPKLGGGGGESMGDKSMSMMEGEAEMKEEIRRRDEFFVLCFADKNAPLEPIKYPNPAYTLQMLYRKGMKLGRILGLQCVGDINERIQTGRTKELILLSEAYHDQQIVHIATAIKQRHKAKGVRAVLISGPSSSGKTTFACKLAIQLKLCGLLPVGLQVDMYYKSTKDPSHPRDENGVLNFEIIDALRLDLLNEHLKTLLDGGTITEPFFDFSCGDIDVSRSKRKLQLHPRRGVLIMEGIFCLNPKMSSSIGASKYQIFICPTPFYNLDNLNFLSEQVVRLIRRVSRDNKHRGANAEGTLFKWGQIQKGEELNMFSFVHLADCVFNSCLVYELPVLNAYSKPLLQTVNPSSPQFKDAKTLRAFCDSFVAMPDSDIPRSSLLMEFIKSSVFDEIDS